MEYSNPLRKPRIEKVVVNIGVGESGEKLGKAEKLLELLTSRKPVRTISTRKIPAWDLKKGEPIGCKVTLRGKPAEEFIIRVLPAIENKIKDSAVDNSGNISFGINEYIDIQGVKYNPDIGIFGMNITITLERPGYRVKRRKLQRSSIPVKNNIRKEEALALLKEKFGVDVE